MKGNQETFKRYEIKYIVDSEQYDQLMEHLEGKFLIDQYGRVIINNIYYDTPDFQLIQRSLEKPVYKEKLRLRSYGTPKDGEMVFVELKKKYKGIVYKRREKMELSQADAYLRKVEQPPKGTQITREIDWFLKSYPKLQPAMYISYSRIAMHGVDNPNLRITFDKDILWRVDQLNLKQGVYGNLILEPGQQLMEIKIPAAMPLWLSHLLDELGIYPSSFSKYGRGYLEYMKQNLQRNTKEKKYA